MTFQIPASKASFAQNRFEIVLPNEYDGDGNPIEAAGVTKFSLPKVQYLNADVQQRMTKLGMSLKHLLDQGGTPDPQAVGDLLDFQRELFDRYAPGLFERLGDDQMIAVLQAWQAESNMTVGESSPSAD